MVQVSVKLDLSHYTISEEQTKSILTKTLDYTTQDLMANLRKNSPVDTGALQGSWMQFTKGELSREVKSSKIYADYLDKGTGLYGPKKKLITPKKKDGVLRFKSKGVFTHNAPNGGKGKDGFVYAKSVEGIKPRHFVSKSISQTRNRVNDFAIKAIMES